MNHRLTIISEVIPRQQAAVGSFISPLLTAYCKLFSVFPARNKLRHPERAEGISLEQSIVRRA